MSATFWGVLIVFLASISILAVLLVGLVRQSKGLARTLRSFQERVQPLAEQLARDGAAAQDRLQDLSMATRSLSARGSAPPNGSTADPSWPRGTEPGTPPR